MEDLKFKPTLLGTIFQFEDGEEDDVAMITDQREEDIYIESKYFTGWLSTACFYERLGIEE